MFLWLGLKLPINFEMENRNKVEALADEYRFKQTAFSLPQHISLKIAFECDDYKSVIEGLKNEVLSNQKPFTVETKKLEINPGIIWIKFQESNELVKLHDDIIKFLETKHGIIPHEFDLEFIYHSTLVYDFDLSHKDLKKVYRLLKKQYKRTKLEMANIIFGISENNEPKTFRIVDNFDL